MAKKQTLIPPVNVTQNNSSQLSQTLTPNQILRTTALTLAQQAECASQIVYPFSADQTLARAQKYFEFLVK